MQKQTFYEYINLHFTKDDGSQGVFRASPNHGIILPAQAIPHTNPQAAPGPGPLKQMRRVQVAGVLNMQCCSEMIWDLSYYG